MSKKIRLIHDHAVNLDDEYDFHEWCLLGQPIHAGRLSGATHNVDYPGHQYLDSLGRPNRGAWRRWLTLRCNNTDCPAIAVVAEDWLIEQAVAALTEDGR